MASKIVAECQYVCYRGTSVVCSTDSSLRHLPHYSERCGEAVQWGAGAVATNAARVEVRGKLGIDWVKFSWNLHMVVVVLVNK